MLSQLAAREMARLDELRSDSDSRLRCFLGHLRGLPA
jgi:hypothetical protein